ncbi:integrase-like protein [Rhodovulum marinum]|uniref:Integrase-like protein n=1 Tax=Rhodovulum marinum TaxID=320662 RepID=A0A4R2Q0A1_9RHOB|nr:integrase-like protein [Rhodovulum marinum]
MRREIGSSTTATYSQPLAVQISVKSASHFWFGRSASKSRARMLSALRRLMCLMGLIPIYQKPDTSRPAKGHKTYSSLLIGLPIDSPNQVWCVDITYLPMRRGFLYLVAIMDWHTCKVLASRVSNTLKADFCVEAMTEAIHNFGTPEIMSNRGFIPTFL